MSEPIELKWWMLIRTAKNSRPKLEAQTVAGRYFTSSVIVAVISDDTIRTKSGSEYRLLPFHGGEPKLLTDLLRDEFAADQPRETEGES